MHWDWRFLAIITSLPWSSWWKRQTAILMHSMLRGVESLLWGLGTKRTVVGPRSYLRRPRFVSVTGLSIVAPTAAPKLFRRIGQIQECYPDRL